ncbi:beta-ketoacyl synthase N-terminal-like domain-containing protein [Streptomyces sp. SHP 1-2]|uniref:beta-ketoacyl synthase N-terminal-like domain-containing protein n=1 Tax=Streptomyces sp. SHP 1-2 TaxID=2769489 RepID=UPI002238E428|nr:beta-ketoacyl synthase N-terminal-like domain-containing protein [Streptomyces sp. SHP 1-2]MCW5249035.1 hypothetical protein [Streptomyces sp. SHP 1-2]
MRADDKAEPSAAPPVPTDGPTPAGPPAITAVAAVTASGATVAELFDDLLGGRRRFTTERIPLVANALPPRPSAGAYDDSREIHAAHVRRPLPLGDVVGPRVDRTLTWDARLLIHAAHTAWPDRSGHLPERTGVVLGTLRAGRNEYIAIHNAAGHSGLTVNPVWGPHSGYNAAAAQLSIVLPAEGPNLTLTSGATAGLEALAVGVRCLEDGVCDTVLAAGLDTLSAAVGGAPEGADGVPEGEAAAVLLLERAGAGEGRALARVLGTGRDAAAPPPAGAGAVGDGATGSAPGGTADGEPGGAAAGGSRARDTAPGAALLAGAARNALREALREAGRRPAEVGLAVVHSTGDPASGTALRAALDAEFGDGPRVCDVTATTGRTGGADGALAAAVAVEAIRRGVLPPAGTGGGGSGWEPPGGRLALCLSVDAGGSCAAVLLGGPETVEDDVNGRGEHA